VIIEEALMRSRIVPVLVAVAALLAVPALSATAAPDSPSTPEPVPSDWPNQTRLLDAAVTIEAAAQERYPQIYAGIALDLPGDALIVYRKPSAEFEGTMAALVPHVTVRYAYAAHSERQIATWQAEVFADRDYWHRRGIDIHGTAPRVGQCVEVEVENPDRDGAAILAHYADRPICVEQGWPAVPLVGP
jgi:hypothetical protein